MKKAIALLSTLLLLGAGCAQPAPVAPQPAPVPAATKPEAVVPTETTDEEAIEAETGTQEEDETEPAVEVSVALNLSMDAGNFFFKPDTITAKAGQTVNVTINSNEGFHTFVIDAINFKKSTKTGESFSFVAPTTAGSYEFYCDVGSHKSMGMVGTLIVE